MTRPSTGARAPGASPGAAAGHSAGLDFDAVYGQLASNCGMSPAEIRATLWSDYLRLARHWAGHPPLRDMVQAFLGIKTKGAPEPAAGATTIAALKNAFPGGRL